MKQKANIYSDEFVVVSTPRRLANVVWDRLAREMRKEDRPVAAFSGSELVVERSSQEQFADLIAYIIGEK